MRIMLTANLSVANGLTNGSMGTVVGIVYFPGENDHFPEVLIQFDTSLVRVVFPPSNVSIPSPQLYAPG